MKEGQNIEIDGKKYKAVRTKHASCSSCAFFDLRCTKLMFSEVECWDEEDQRVLFVFEEVR